jgi:hypothetical protein
MGRNEGIIPEKVSGLLQGKYRKEEIFKMTQKEDEILEDYIERFQYNLQWSKHSKLDEKTL